MARFAAALAAAAGAASLAAAGPVIVVVDMDSSRPGIQSTVHVPAGTRQVPGVAVYIYDPEGTRSCAGIGYFGGLDRGIALGHTPSNQNYGRVTGLDGHLGTPVNPGATAFAFAAHDPGFYGAEVQYIETGGTRTAFRSSPSAAIFTVDINLDGTQAGDAYEFYLLDMVSVWRGEGGAFSTQPGVFTLDTGGDAVPDGTLTRYGFDPDAPAPAPPAAFEVDYIDGGVGPARVVVGGCYANCDGSTFPPVLNVSDFVCFQQRYAAGSMYANCDGSTAAPVLNVNDFVCFLSRYAEGCN